MKKKNNLGCEMCERDLVTTSHHLIPQQVHSKNWCKKMFTKDDMKNRRADLCRDCHPYLHKKFTHAELAKHYNTVELILANSEVAKHIVWLKKQRKKVKR